MEHYRVVVKVRKLDGFDASEELEYFPVYSISPEAAANSVVVEKKVKKEDIIAVRYERMY